MLCKYFLLFLIFFFSNLCYSGKNLFIVAIMNADTRLIRQMVRQGAHLDRCIDRNGVYTLLQYAALVGSNIMVSELLNLGATLPHRVRTRCHRYSPYTLRRLPETHCSRSRGTQHIQGEHHGRMLSLGTTDIPPVCARTLINIGMDRLHISEDISEDEYSLAVEACGGTTEVGWILLNYDGSTINQIHTHSTLPLRWSYHSRDFILFLLLLQSGVDPNVTYHYSEGSEFGLRLLSYRCSIFCSRL